MLAKVDRLLERLARREGVRLMLGALPDGDVQTLAREVLGSNPGPVVSLARFNAGACDRSERLPPTAAILAPPALCRPPRNEAGGSPHTSYPARVSPSDLGLLSCYDLVS